MKEEEETVVVSSDSDEDESSVWIKKSKNKQFQNLWEKVQPILFHHVLPENKSTYFPYEKFKELAEDMRKSLKLVYVDSTQAFIWKNCIRWLVSMKLCYEGISDLKYDERYNLILTDYMAQYLNYKCNLYSTITNETEVRRRVDEILVTLGTVFSGNIPSILMTLLKIEVKDVYRLILDPIFRKYLSNKKLHEPNELISYLRLILCYRQWKKLFHFKEQKELINEIAVGKSDKFFRSRSHQMSADLTTLEAVLPKMVPKFNETNQSFAAISGLIRIAMEEPYGTRTLLIRKSLDLDETIVRYFQKYETHISQSDTILCESTKALRIFDDICDISDCTAPIPQPMLLQDLKRSPSRDESLLDHTPLTTESEQQTETNKEAQQGLQIVNNIDKQGTKAVNQHLSVDCDTSRISNALHFSNLSSNSDKLSLIIKEKTQNSSSSVKLGPLSDKVSSVIELDTTDGEDDNIDNVDKDTTVSCEKQTNKKRGPSLRCSLLGKLQQRAAAIGSNSSFSRSKSPISLSSSSDEDDIDPVAPVRQAGSRNMILSNRNLNQQRAIGAQNSAVEGLNRPVDERKKLRCITGEVSSTTSLDYSTNLDAESSAARHIGGLENAREVGTLSAVRTSPRCGSIIADNDYSDISDDEAGPSSLTSGRKASGSSSKFSKVVEEATSSTSEMWVGGDVASENIVFSMHPTRALRSTSSSPSMTRTSSPIDNTTNNFPSSTIRLGRMRSGVTNQAQVTSGSRVNPQRLNSLASVAVEDEVATCSRLVERPAPVPIFANKSSKITERQKEMHANLENSPIPNIMQDGEVATCSRYAVSAAPRVSNKTSPIEIQQSKQDFQHSDLVTPRTTIETEIEKQSKPTRTSDSSPAQIAVNNIHHKAKLPIGEGDGIFELNKFLDDISDHIGEPQKEHSVQIIKEKSGLSSLLSYSISKEETGPETRNDSGLENNVINQPNLTEILKLRSKSAENQHKSIQLEKVTEKLQNQHMKSNSTESKDTSPNAKCQKSNTEISQPEKSVDTGQAKDANVNIIHKSPNLTVTVPQQQSTENSFDDSSLYNSTAPQLIKHQDALKTTESQDSCKTTEKKCDNLTTVFENDKLKDSAPKNSVSVDENFSETKGFDVDLIIALDQQELLTKPSNVADSLNETDSNFVTKHIVCSELLTDKSSSSIERTDCCLSHTDDELSNQSDEIESPAYEPVVPNTIDMSEDVVKAIRAEQSGSDVQALQQRFISEIADAKIEESSSSITKLSSTQNIEHENANYVSNKYPDLKDCSKDKDQKLPDAVEMNDEEIFKLYITEDEVVQDDICKESEVETNISVVGNFVERADNYDTKEVAREDPITTVHVARISNKEGKDSIKGRDKTKTNLNFDENARDQLVNKKQNIYENQDKETDNGNQEKKDCHSPKPTHIKERESTKQTDTVKCMHEKTIDVCVDGGDINLLNSKVVNDVRNSGTNKLEENDNRIAMAETSTDIFNETNSQEEKTQSNEKLIPNEMGCETEMLVVENHSTEHKCATEDTAYIEKELIDLKPDVQKCDELVANKEITDASPIEKYIEPSFVDTNDFHNTKTVLNNVGKGESVKQKIAVSNCIDLSFIAASKPIDKEPNSADISTGGNAFLEDKTTITVIKNEVNETNTNEVVSEVATIVSNKSMDKDSVVEKAFATKIRIEQNQNSDNLEKDNERQETTSEKSDHTIEIHSFKSVEENSSKDTCVELDTKLSTDLDENEKLKRKNNSKPTGKSQSLNTNNCSELEAIDKEGISTPRRVKGKVTEKIISKNLHLLSAVIETTAVEKEAIKNNILNSTPKIRSKDKPSLESNSSLCLNQEIKSSNARIIDSPVCSKHFGKKINSNRQANSALNKIISTPDEIQFNCLKTDIEGTTIKPQNKCISTRLTNAKEVEPILTDSSKTKNTAEPFTQLNDHNNVKCNVVSNKQESSVEIANESSLHPPPSFEHLVAKSKSDPFEKTSIFQSMEKSCLYHSWSTDHELPLGLELRKDDDILNEDDSNLSTQVQITAEDLGDPLLSFESETSENHSLYQNSFDTSQRLSPARQDESKPTVLSDSVSHKEDQEVSEITSQESQSIIYNSYNEDCGTPVLDEKDAEEIESPTSQPKIISLSVLKENSKLSHRPPKMLTFSNQIDPYPVTVIVPKPIVSLPFETVEKSSSSSQTNNEKTITPVVNNSVENHVTVTTPTTPTSEFIEPSPKPKPTTIETDSVYQRTPLKIRMKRRISQCGDDFNLGPSDPIISVSKLPTTGKHEEPTKNYFEKTQPKFEPLISDDPLDLVIRSERNSIDADINVHTERQFPPSNEAQSLNEEDQNLQYQESWFKKLGISKTSHKPISKDFYSPTVIQPHTSYFIPSDELTTNQREIVPNLAENVKVMGKNVGRRKKPKRVTKLSENIDVVPDDFPDANLNSPIVPLTVISPTAPVPIEPHTSLLHTKKPSIDTMINQTPVTETTYNPEDIKAATILSDMLKKSNKSDESLTIEPQKSTKSDKTRKNKKARETSPQFTRLTRSTSQLIDKPPLSDTDTVPPPKKKCRERKKPAKTKKVIPCTESIWQPEKTQEILRSITEKSTQNSTFLDECPGLSKRSEFSVLLNYTSDSDDAGKLVIDLDGKQNKKSKQKSKAKMTMNNRRKICGKIGLEKKVTELLQKANENAEMKEEISPPVVKYDESVLLTPHSVYKLTPEVDVIFSNVHRSVSSRKVCNIKKSSFNNLTSERNTSEDEVAQLYPIVQLTEDVSFTPKTTRKRGRKRTGVIRSQPVEKTEEFANTSNTRSSSKSKLSVKSKLESKFEREKTSAIDLEQSEKAKATSCQNLSLNEVCSNKETNTKMCNDTARIPEPNQKVRPKQRLSFSIDAILGNQEEDPQLSNEESISPHINMNKEMWLTSFSLQKTQRVKELPDGKRKAYEMLKSSSDTCLNTLIKDSTSRNVSTEQILLQDLKSSLPSSEVFHVGKLRNRRKSLVTIRRLTINNTTKIELQGKECDKMDILKAKTERPIKNRRKSRCSSVHIINAEPNANSDENEIISEYEKNSQLIIATRKSEDRSIEQEKEKHSKIESAKLKVTISKEETKEQLISKATAHVTADKEELSGAICQRDDKELVKSVKSATKLTQKTKGTKKSTESNKTQDEIEEQLNSKTSANEALKCLEPQHQETGEKANLKANEFCSEVSSTELVPIKPSVSSATGQLKTKSVAKGNCDETGTSKSKTAAAKCVSEKLTTIEQRDQKKSKPIAKGKRDATAVPKSEISAAKLVLEKTDDASSIAQRTQVRLKSVGKAKLEPTGIPKSEISAAKAVSKKADDISIVEPREQLKSKSHGKGKCHAPEISKTEIPAEKLVTEKAEDTSFVEHRKQVKSKYVDEVKFKATETVHLETLITKLVPEKTVVTSTIGTRKQLRSQSVGKGKDHATAIPHSKTTPVTFVSEKPDVKSNFDAEDDKLTSFKKVKHDATQITKSDISAANLDSEKGDDKIEKGEQAKSESFGKGKRDAAEVLQSEVFATKVAVETSTIEPQVQVKPESLEQGKTDATEVPQSKDSGAAIVSEKADETITMEPKAQVQSKSLGKGKRDATETPKLEISAVNLTSKKSGGTRTITQLEQVKSETLRKGKKCTTAVPESEVSATNISLGKADDTSTVEQREQAKSEYFDKGNSDAAEITKSEVYAAKLISQKTDDTTIEPQEQIESKSLGKGKCDDAEVPKLEVPNVKLTSEKKDDAITIEPPAEVKSESLVKGRCDAAEVAKSDISPRKLILEKANDKVSIEPQEVKSKSFGKGKCDVTKINKSEISAVNLASRKADDTSSIEPREQVKSKTIGKRKSDTADYSESKVSAETRSSQKVDDTSAIELREQVKSKSLAKGKRVTDQDSKSEVSVVKLALEKVDTSTFEEQEQVRSKSLRKGKRGSTRFSQSDISSEKLVLENADDTSTMEPNEQARSKSLGNGKSDGTKIPKSDMSVTIAASEKADVPSAIEQREQFKSECLDREKSDAAEVIKSKVGKRKRNSTTEIPKLENSAAMFGSEKTYDTSIIDSRKQIKSKCLEKEKRDAAEVPKSEVSVAALTSEKEVDANTIEPRVEVKSKSLRKGKRGSTGLSKSAGKLVSEKSDDTNTIEPPEQVKSKSFGKEKCDATEIPKSEISVQKIVSKKADDTIVIEPQEQAGKCDATDIPKSENFTEKLVSEKADDTTTCELQEQVKSKSLGKGKRDADETPATKTSSARLRKKKFANTFETTDIPTDTKEQVKLKSANCAKVTTAPSQCKKSLHEASRSAECQVQPTLQSSGSAKCVASKEKLPNDEASMCSDNILKQLKEARVSKASENRAKSHDQTEAEKIFEFSDELDNTINVETSKGTNNQPKEIRCPSTTTSLENELKKPDVLTCAGSLENNLEEISEQTKLRERSFTSKIKCEELFKKKSSDRVMRSAGSLSNSETVDAMKQFNVDHDHEEHSDRQPRDDSNVKTIPELMTVNVVTETESVLDETTKTPVEPKHMAFPENFVNCTEQIANAIEIPEKATTGREKISQPEEWKNHDVPDEEGKTNQDTPHNNAKSEHVNESLNSEACLNIINTVESAIKLEKTGHQLLKDPQIKSDIDNSNITSAKRNSEPVRPSPNIQLQTEESCEPSTESPTLHLQVGELTKSIKDAVVITDTSSDVEKLVSAAEESKKETTSKVVVVPKIVLNQFQSNVSPVSKLVNAEQIVVQASSIKCSNQKALDSLTTNDIIGKITKSKLIIKIHRFDERFHKTKMHSKTQMKLIIHSKKKSKRGKKQKSVASSKTKKDDSTIVQDNAREVVDDEVRKCTESTNIIKKSEMEKTKISGQNVEGIPPKLIGTPEISLSGESINSITKLAEVNEKETNEASARTLQLNDDTSCDDSINDASIKAFHSNENKVDTSIAVENLGDAEKSKPLKSVPQIVDPNLVQQEGACDATPKNEVPKLDTETTQNSALIPLCEESTVTILKESVTSQPSDHKQILVAPTIDVKVAVTKTIAEQKELGTEPASKIHVKTNRSEVRIAEDFEQEELNDCAAQLASADRKIICDQGQVDLNLTQTSGVRIPELTPFKEIFSNETTQHSVSIPLCLENTPTILKESVTSEASDHKQILVKPTVDVKVAVRETIAEQKELETKPASKIHVMQNRSEVKLAEDFEQEELNDCAAQPTVSDSKIICDQGQVNLSLTKTSDVRIPELTPFKETFSKENTKHSASISLYEESTVTILKESVTSQPSDHKQILVAPTVDVKVAVTETISEQKEFGNEPASKIHITQTTSEAKISQDFEQEDVDECAAQPAVPNINIICDQRHVDLNLTQPSDVRIPELTPLKETFSKETTQHSASIPLYEENTVRILKENVSSHPSDHKQILVAPTVDVKVAVTETIAEQKDLESEPASKIHVMQNRSVLYDCAAQPAVPDNNIICDQGQVDLNLTKTTDVRIPELKETSSKANEMSCKNKVFPPKSDWVRQRKRFSLDCRVVSSTSIRKRSHSIDGNEFRFVETPNKKIKLAPLIIIDRNSPKIPIDEKLNNFMQLNLPKPHLKRKRMSLDCDRSLLSSPKSLRARSYSTDMDKPVLEEAQHKKVKLTSLNLDLIKIQFNKTQEIENVLSNQTSSCYENKPKDEVQIVAEQLELSINNILGNKLPDTESESSPCGMSKIILTNRPRGFDSVPDDIFAGNGDPSENIETKFYPAILKPEDLMIKTTQVDETHDAISSEGEARTAKFAARDHDTLSGHKNSDSEEGSDADKNESENQTNAGSSEGNSAPELELDTFPMTSIADINVIGNSSIFEDSCIPDFIVQNDCLKDVLDGIIDLTPFSSDCMISGSYGDEFDNDIPLYMLEPPLLFLETDDMTDVNRFDARRQNPKRNIVAENFSTSKNEVSTDDELDFENELFTYPGLVSIQSRENSTASSEKNHAACDTLTQENPAVPSAEAIFEPKSAQEDDFLFKKPNSLQISTEDPVADVPQESATTYYVPPVEVSTEVGFESYDELLADNKQFFPTSNLEKDKKQEHSSNEEDENSIKESASENVSVPVVNEETSANEETIKPEQTPSTAVLTDFKEPCQEEQQMPVPTTAESIGKEAKQTKVDTIKKQEKETTKSSPDRKTKIDLLIAKAKSSIPMIPVQDDITSPPKLKTRPNRFWGKKSNKSEAPPKEKSESIVEQQPPQIKSDVAGSSNTSETIKIKKPAGSNLNLESNIAKNKPAAVTGPISINLSASVVIQEESSLAVILDLTDDLKLKEPLKNMPPKSMPQLDGFTEEVSSVVPLRALPQLDEVVERKHTMKSNFVLQEQPSKKPRMEPVAKLSTDDVFDRLKRESPVNPLMETLKPTLKKSPSFETDDTSSRDSSTGLLTTFASPSSKSKDKFPPPLKSHMSPPPLSDSPAIGSPMAVLSILPKVESLPKLLDSYDPVNGCPKLSIENKNISTVKTIQSPSMSKTTFDKPIISNVILKCDRINNDMKNVPEVPRNSSKSDVSEKSIPLKGDVFLPRSSSKSDVSEKSIPPKDDVFLPPANKSDSSATKSMITPPSTSAKNKFSEKIPTRTSAPVEVSKPPISSKANVKSSTSGVSFSSHVTNLPPLNPFALKPIPLTKSTVESPSQSQKHTKSILKSPSKASSSRPQSYSPSQSQKSIKSTPVSKHSSSRSSTNSPSMSQKTPKPVPSPSKSTSTKKEVPSTSYSPKLVKPILTPPSATPSTSTVTSKRTPKTPMPAPVSSSSRPPATDHSITIASLTAEIQTLSERLQELPEVAGTYGQYKKRNAVLKLHEEKLKKLEELKKLHLEEAARNRMSFSKSRSHSERQPSEKHPDHRMAVHRSQRDLHKDKPKESRQAYVNKFWQLKNKSFENIGKTDHKVNTTKESKVLPSWEWKPASTEEIIADLKTSRRN